MTKVKGSKKYFYHYPENEVLANLLRYRDRTRLSISTGYSVQYISSIFKGSRKMPAELLNALLELRPEAKKYIKKIPVIPISQNQNT